MTGSIDDRADFSQIRYAQVWEDADVMLEALQIQPGDHCLSIASAGDNALAMLTRDPSEVVAVDLSPPQLACLGLRIAAYRCLEHPELLGLIGSRPHPDRWALFERCRRDGKLSDEHARFWSTRREAIEAGIGAAGKFERYFRLFRKLALPLAHPKRRVEQLIMPKNVDQRLAFYHDHWDTRRWRALFHAFFSRRLMGVLGRDPEFFRYVEGNVASRILRRASHAMTELDPSQNPYMTWILTGAHRDALPLALRPEHFDTIRDRLDRVRLVHGSLESAAEQHGPFDRHNLSDVFEYLSPSDSEQLLEAIVASSNAGARLVYWNMLVPRSRPEVMKKTLIEHRDEADRLLLTDKAFFYARLVIEEVRG
ncbi:MAG: DUF3419 family protein [Planctomycetota bacterium]